MRTIDADELRKQFSSEDGPYGPEGIKSIIDNAPTVTPTLPTEVQKALEVLKRIEHNRWVPVSERLPKQGNQSYLVTVDYGDGLVCSCQRFFFNDDIGWNDDCVIAWQPLPEPYKEGDKEE